MLLFCASATEVTMFVSNQPTANIKKKSISASVYTKINGNIMYQPILAFD